jgi:hypothetical protein
MRHESIHQFRDACSDCSREYNVNAEWQMRAVLLERAARNENDGTFLNPRGVLGPRQFVHQYGHSGSEPFLVELLENAFAAQLGQDLVDLD